MLPKRPQPPVAQAIAPQTAAIMQGKAGANALLKRANFNSAATVASTTTESGIDSGLKTPNYRNEGRGGGIAGSSYGERGILTGNLDVSRSASRGLVGADVGAGDSVVGHYGPQIGPISSAAGFEKLDRERALKRREATLLLVKSTATAGKQFMGSSTTLTAPKHIHLGEFCCEAVLVSGFLAQTCRRPHCSACFW